MAGPLVLAFDTGGPQVAATLMEGDRPLATRAEQMARGQAERLFPMIEEILAAQGLDWSALGVIGVGIGPGNFTGVRISVSAARGLSMALGIPAVGVSTLQALAHGCEGVGVASADARGGQVYVQCFDGAGTAPVLCTLPDLPEVPARSEPACIGHRAAEIAALCTGRVAEPRYPLTEAVARIALARRDRTREPPAPLYVRPADAAPPRDAGPVILGP